MKIMNFIKTTFLLIIILPGFLISCEKNNSVDLIVECLGWETVPIINPKIYIVGDYTTPLIEEASNPNGSFRVDDLLIGNYCLEFTYRYTSGDVVKRIIFQIKSGETTIISI